MFLLANKADINAKDKHGYTPLHRMAFNGIVEMVEWLLENKADVSAVTDKGSTPLHLAIMDYHKEVVEALLSHKANINAKNNLGYTALHCAAICSNWESDRDMAKLLLAHKAEYDIHDVAAIGELEMVKALLRDNPVLVCDKDDAGYTPLHDAAETRPEGSSRLPSGQ